MVRSLRITPVNATARLYADHNAGAPLLPAARVAMRVWLDEALAGNASSVHAEGRRARAAVSQARLAVARAIGVSDRLAERAIIFCSGATEANALALGSARGRIVTSAAEHPSILGPSGAAGATIVPVLANGQLDLEALAAALPGAALCSLHLANNETGVLQDARALASLCKDNAVLLHFDAAQAFGRLALDVEALGADYLTLSSHKIGGPTGAGALYARPGSAAPGSCVAAAPVVPLYGGGHQERGRRPGTENVLGLVGFGAAVRQIPERLDAMAALAARRDHLWDRLSRLGAARVGQGPWLPNTLTVAFEDLEGESLVMALDLEGVAASTGSACTSGSVEPSHVLLAMGYDDDAARRVVRFSFGPETTGDEFDRCALAVATVVERARRERVT